MLFYAELVLTPKQDWTAAETNRRYSISMSPFVACVEALDDDEEEGGDVNVQEPTVLTLTAPKNKKRMKQFLCVGSQ